MAYIGRRPQYGAFEKQTITADSSTTTFTLDYVVGSSSSMLVSVAGVPQEPGVAYTLAGGGASIVFAEAPTTGDTVFIVFLGVAMETLTVGTGTITSQTEITTALQATDMMLYYDNSATGLKKINPSTLLANPIDAKLITERTALGALAADGDQLLIYDADAGVMKKVNKSNIATVITYPTVTGVSESTIDISTLTTITVTGTDFVNGCKVEFQNSSTGALTTASTVSHTNATTLSVGANLTSGTYFIRVENPDGNAGRSSSAIITVSGGPVWQTAAGSLGSAAGGDAISFSAYATEADSGALTYALVSGSLPGGCSLSVDNNIAYITGTESGSEDETTYTFSLEVTDPESQKATREFTITITHGANNGGLFH